MKNSSPIRARDFIANLAASGRHHFTSSDARIALQVSPDAAKLALRRLAQQGVIAQPARGFYVVVPPEYRSLGCLPADQFIPALMEQLELPYYASLLSAAQYHGAAHHRPQMFQVMLERSRRPLRCGQVRVVFVRCKHLQNVPTQSFNTFRGTIRVSTAEATALDLIGYHQHVGGLDQAATVLSELVEQINPRDLVEAAQFAPVSWAQRLGYLLDHFGAKGTAIPLKTYVGDTARQVVPLLSSAPHGKGHIDRNWKVRVNLAVEAEL